MEEYMRERNNINIQPKHPQPEETKEAKLDDNMFLFVSENCEFSKKLYDLLRKYGVLNYFKLIIVENASETILNVVDVTPSLFFLDKKELIEGKDLFRWLYLFITDLNSNIDESNNSVVNDNINDDEDKYTNVTFKDDRDIENLPDKKNIEQLYNERKLAYDNQIENQKKQSTTS